MDHTNPYLARMDLAAVAVFLGGEGETFFTLERREGGTAEFMSSRVTFSEVTTAWTREAMFADTLVCSSGIGDLLYVVSSSTWDTGCRCYVLKSPRDIANAEEFKVDAALDVDGFAYNVSTVSSASSTLVLLEPEEVELDNGVSYTLGLTGSVTTPVRASANTVELGTFGASTPEIALLAQSSAPEQEEEEEDDEDAPMSRMDILRQGALAHSRSRNLNKTVE